ncbi:MAG: signal recognition particle-docking protein FtsY [Thermoprotei archaeon]
MFDTLKKVFSNVSQAVLTRQVSEKELDEVVGELQRELLGADVAYEVTLLISQAVKDAVAEVRVGRTQDVRGAIRRRVEDVLRGILGASAGVSFQRVVGDTVRVKGLCVVVFFGVNGAGKTTTIAKVGHRLREAGFRPLLVGADTFRAGAIEQLVEHAKRLGLPVHVGKYGADPASVGFGALQEARAKGYNVVLVDTAGRMHTDSDLMDEMRKIVRVTKPDLKVFVGEALVGNDAVNQLVEFNQKVGIDGVILTKMDADAKGGVVFTVSNLVKKPIYYIGVGQGYSDLVEFDPEVVLKKLF